MPVISDKHHLCNYSEEVIGRRLLESRIWPENAGDFKTGQIGGKGQMSQGS